MNAHTLETLAFSRIAQMIAQYCTCEEAQQLCLKKEPLIDESAIAAAKKQGADFLQLLQKDNPPAAFPYTIAITHNGHLSFTGRNLCNRPSSGTGAKITAVGEPPKTPYRYHR